MVSNPLCLLWQCLLAAAACVVGLASQYLAAMQAPSNARMRVQWCSSGRSSSPRHSRV